MKMRKRYFKSFAAIFIIACMAISCDSLLDIDPKQNINAETAITSGDDVQLLLISAYEGIKGTFGTNEGGELWGGDFNFISELLATSGDVVWVGSFEEPKEMGRKSMTTTNSKVTANWARAYEVINIVNIVLHNIDVIEDADQKARIEGEAKCIRGMVYFELARFWGLPYQAGQTNSQLAVPLVLSPTIAVGDVTEPVRATVDEVYAQAISDLSEAETLLTDFEDNGGFLSTYAASAYLSRVYLQQGQYAMAATKADRVIQRSDLYDLLTEPLAAFNNTSNVMEDVFAIQQTATSNAGVNNSGLATHYASLFGQGRGDMEISAVFLNIFGPNDTRGGLMTNTVAEETQIGDVTEMYYIGIGDNNSGGINTSKFGDARLNFPVIRIAEMYLTRAEGNFEAGAPYAGGVSPVDDINTIRLRAGTNPVPSVTQDDIRMERYRELCWEGFRLHDLRRWQVDIDVNNAWNADNLVLPIPERETEANPNLIQNDYYLP
jgi:starch-binding outer membrane protein, SusD/RagB family